MASDLTGYRIFIASPGGLQEIREAFRDIIAKYNAEDAIRRGVVFIPVGWELTLGGLGRPQAIINEELDECDAFVLVLHDRWGSNPGSTEGYTSGTEEEYGRALRLAEEASRPMKDILVFFRALEAERLSDPGRQLEQVLEFKKKLERERKLLFHQFESSRDFEDRFRTFLASWIRTHERGVIIAPPLADAEKTPIDAGLSAMEGGKLSLTPLQIASQMHAEGRLTEAEKIYADLAAPNNDPLSLLAYAGFLFGLKRKAQAESIFRKALSVAEATGDVALVGEAQLRLGYALSKKEDFEEAAALLEAATRSFEIVGTHRGLAEARFRLGEVRAVTDRTADAAALFEAALRDLEREDDLEVRADVNAALAQLAFDGEDFDEAARLYVLARRLKVAAGSTRDLADILVGVGATAEKRNRAAEAIVAYNESLPLFEREANLAGQADAYDHLGHAYEALGDTERSLQAYDKAAGIFEAIQKFDSAADAYTSIAKLYQKTGRSADAASAYRQALPLVGRLKNREEVREIYDSLEVLLRAQPTSLFADPDGQS